MRRIAKRFVRPIPLPKDSHPPEDWGDPGPPVTPARLAFYTDSRQGPWTYLACFIAIGGGVYTLLLGPVVLVGQFTAGMWSDFAWGEVLEKLLLETAVLLFGSVVVTLGVGLVAMFVLTLLWGVKGLTRWQASWEGLGCFAGGLVALTINVPTAWVDTRDQSLGSAASNLFFGLMLSTVCLQTAGAYAGITNQRDADRRSEGPPPTQRGFSFSIGQLLILTGVLSVPLAAFRAFGLLNANLMMLVGIWVVWQTLSQYPARWIARWRRRVQTSRFHDTLDRMQAARRSEQPEATPAE